MPNFKASYGVKNAQQTPGAGPGWRLDSLVEIHGGLQSAAHLLGEVARVLSARAAEALPFGVVHVAQVVERSRLSHLWRRRRFYFRLLHPEGKWYNACHTLCNVLAIMATWEEGPLTVYFSLYLIICMVLLFSMNIFLLVLT